MLHNVDQIYHNFENLQIKFIVPGSKTQTHYFQECHNFLLRVRGREGGREREREGGKEGGREGEGRSGGVLYRFKALLIS
jgi:hypothetical protein